MPISFTRYVNIVSGVAGAAAVAVRQLIGRLFTANVLLPAGSFIEFSSASEVGAYFGTASSEYARAQFYFGWVSKVFTSAKKISFARWVSAPCAPQIFGNQAAKLLATFNAITAGSFTLHLGGTSNTFGPLDFSSASSLAQVASIVQAAINGASGTLWTSATVGYDATLRRFTFTGGVTGACTVSATDGTQTPLAALGWLPAIPDAGQQITGTVAAYAIYAPGAAAEDVAASAAASAEASNNFGSLLFMPTLTNDQVLELAEWVNSQNVLYRLCVPVTSADAADISAACIALSGVDLALSPEAGEYPEMVPMIQEAATDYSKRAAASDYMFQVFALTPSVSNDTDADTYDALRVNYYGQTQESGQKISFWQRGVMLGGATAPVDENVFSNESWLKSAAGAAVINLQLALQQIPANVSGANKLTNALQDVVEQALFNGVISVGKPLTATQISAITDMTGDENAWRQVQNSGYWLNVAIVPYTDPTNNLPGYKAEYTLVYSKDDVVRLVDGTHVLI